MKPIQLRKNILDIVFNDDKGNEAFVLHFDRTDKNIERLKKFDDEFKKIAENFDENKATFEETKQFMRTITDGMIEDGAFDRIYSVTPSLQLVMVYLVQIVAGIKEEVEAEDIKAVEAKYLQ